MALGGAVQYAKAYRRNLKISWNSANRPQKFGVGRRPAIINTVLGDIPRKQLGSSNVLGEMSTERYVEWILHDESDKKSW